MTQPNQLPALEKELIDDYSAHVRSKVYEFASSQSSRDFYKFAKDLKKKKTALAADGFQSVRAKCSSEVRTALHDQEAIVNAAIEKVDISRNTITVLQALCRPLELGEDRPTFAVRCMNVLKETDLSKEPPPPFVLLLTRYMVFYLINI